MPLAERLCRRHLGMMVGRPRSFDRDIALDAFVDVFWTFGYEGADVDKLQQAANIQRGSFYAAFKDKPSAFVEALRRYMEYTLLPRLDMLEQEFGQRLALAEFLEAVGVFVAKQGRRGCMLSEALIHSSSHEPALRREVLRIRSNLFRKLKKLSGVMRRSHPSCWRPLLDFTRSQGLAVPESKYWPHLLWPQMRSYG